MITGAFATLFLVSCSKTDDKVAEKTLEQEKMEYQMRQLDLEKQKLAIEQEKFAYEKQKAEDSIARANQPAPVVTPRPAVRQAYVAPAPARRTTQRRTYAAAPQPTYSAPAPAASSGSNDGYATNTGTTQTVQKKKMSNAAKGAIIGTAAGAIGGAVISKKNPGMGAVVGGIVGGATGYTIGKSRDNNQNVYTPSTSY